ncbi:unnamed protein product [Withania somnifera]
MSSMIFASSPLSVQSLVKLRTNSNYPHSSCYIPSASKAKSSYNIHLSYKNISHIESSKSSFTKGDGNFSFSLPKFPRVSSTLSSSLNIIKACSVKENIYDFKAYDMRTRENILLKDRYMGTVLLIVNIPQQDSQWAKTEIEFLNDLRKQYENKQSATGKKGFEVLGFLHDKDELSEKSENGEIPMGEEEILKAADFPIFGKVVVNDVKKDEDLWYFLRTTPIGETNEIVKIIKEEFEKFLVNKDGKPIQHYPRFSRGMVQSQSPGPISNLQIFDPTSPEKERPSQRLTYN